MNKRTPARAAAAKPNIVVENVDEERLSFKISAHSNETGNLQNYFEIVIEKNIVTELIVTRLKNELKKILPLIDESCYSGKNFAIVVSDVLADICSNSDE